MSEKKENMLRAFLWCLVLTLVVIFSVYHITSKELTRLAGPVLLALGLVPLAVLKINNKSLAFVGADVSFGAFDTGFMTIAALTGATFAGVLGAVVGAGAGDAITDAWAGLVEGRVASWLRERGIEEARRPFSTSMGKMSGCLLGAGVTVSLARVRTPVRSKPTLILSTVKRILIFAMITGFPSFGNSPRYSIFQSLFFLYSKLYSSSMLSHNFLPVISLFKIVLAWRTENIQEKGIFVY